MRRKQQIAAGMAIVFLVIFLISAVVVTNYFLESKKQEAVFQALEHIAEQETCLLYTSYTAERGAIHARQMGRLGLVIT